MAGWLSPFDWNLISLKIRRRCFDEMNGRTNERTEPANLLSQQDEEERDTTVTSWGSRRVRCYSGRTTWRTAASEQATAAWFSEKYRPKIGLWPRSRLRRKLKIQRAEGKFGDGEQEGEIKGEREALVWVDGGGEGANDATRGLKMEIDAHGGEGKNRRRTDETRVTFGVVKSISRG